MLKAFVDETLGFPAKFVLVAPSGQTAFELRYPVALLSGSFNPMHSAHRALRAAAVQFLRRPCYYELSVVNVDKDPLTGEQAEARLARLSNEPVPVVVTKAPKFTDKAEAMPGTVFVVGSDTAERILSPRYGDVLADLDVVERNNCWFLVGARKINGHTVRLGDLRVPERYRHLFAELPPDEYMFQEISSSDIRGGKPDHQARPVPDMERFLGEEEHYVAVDFDRTLAVYDHFRGVTHLGPPVPAMQARVRGWLAAGIKVKIFTARVGPGPEQRDVEAVRTAMGDWTEEHLGQRLEITNIKDYLCDEFWDDRAVAVEANTGRPMSISGRGLE